MKPGRALYRTRQFWHALRAAPRLEDLERVQAFLSPRLFELFLRMSLNEQAHSIHVFNKLIERGENDPDLLAAALLHDVGKSRFPLALWERVSIVVVKAVAPQTARHMGDAKRLRMAGSDNHPDPPHGERVPWQYKSFLVAEQHPAWGASLAARAGASALACALIRRHQDAPSQTPESLEDILLAKLQSVDDES